MVAVLTSTTSKGDVLWVMHLENASYRNVYKALVSDPGALEMWMAFWISWIPRFRIYLWSPLHLFCPQRISWYGNSHHVILKCFLRLNTDLLVTIHPKPRVLRLLHLNKIYNLIIKYQSRRCWQVIAHDVVSEVTRLF